MNENTQWTLRSWRRTVVLKDMSWLVSSKQKFSKKGTIIIFLYQQAAGEQREFRKEESRPI